MGMANQWLLAILSILSSQLFAVVQDRATITPVIISGGGSDRCPLQEERRSALDDISRLSGILDIPQLRLQSQCGDGVWYRVAHLNMSDPSQHCPSAWRENSPTINLKLFLLVKEVAHLPHFQLYHWLDHHVIAECVEGS